MRGHARVSERLAQRPAPQYSRQGILMRPIYFIIAAVLLLVALPVMAAPDLHDASATYSGLLELIRTSANRWSYQLRGYAINLFWGLALIQLVLTFAPLVIKHADFSEIMGELLRFVMTIGFFAALLIYSVEWAEAIINSFRQAGAAAAGVGVGLRPGDMFGLAVELARTVGNTDTWNPAVAGAVMLSATIILLCFAFIAAFMGLTLIESYIVINASVLFMGLGGLQYTREYAVTMLRYALSVGAKLFVLTLLVGLIMEAARQWQVAYRHDDTSTWTMVGLALGCAYFSKTIPELIQALITGVSPGGGSIIGGMAAAGAAFGAAAMATLSTATSSGLLSGGTAKGVADLVGSSLSGGGSAAASAAPSMMKSALGGMGSAFSGGGSSGAPSSPSTPPVNKAQKVANAAHKMTSGALRTGGVLSAISVPGMEGATDLSIGPPPPPIDGIQPDMPIEDTDT